MNNPSLFFLFSVVKRVVMTIMVLPLFIISSYAQPKVEGRFVTDETPPLFAFLTIPSIKVIRVSPIVNGKFYFDLSDIRIPKDKTVESTIWWGNFREDAKMAVMGEDSRSFLIEDRLVTLKYYAKSSFLKVEGGVDNEHYQIISRLGSTKNEGYKKMRNSSEMNSINYQYANQLLQCVKDHPSSKVFTPWFWSIVRLFPKTEKSYKLIKEVYDGMPQSFKNSPSGKLVIRELKILKAGIQDRKDAEESIIGSIDLRCSTGSTKNLHSYRAYGLIVIDFWTTYCAPCKLDKPFLADIEKKFSTGNIIFLKLAADKRYETWKTYMDRRGSGPNNFWVDQARYANNILISKLRKFPTYIIVDAGNMRVLKWDVDLNEIEEYLQKFVGVGNGVKALESSPGC